MTRVITVNPMVDTHVHLREIHMTGELAKLSLAGGASTVLFMPNTDAGLKTADQVTAYHTAATQSANNKHLRIIPTLLINEETSPEEINRCLDAGITDCKVYPLNRTTKSHNGVRHYNKVLTLVKHRRCSGMKVHFHPEYPLMSIGNRDAELAFLSILDMFLNETCAIIISEHGTDARCIPAWKEMAKSNRFYVTLTAHHLAENEDGAFGDVRSACKPPIKSEPDRRGLISLIKENYDWVMAGSDSAPHPDVNKHVDHGQCACGAFTSPFLLPLYAHALDELLQTKAGISTFINFTSRNAHQLHQLPSPETSVTLMDKPFIIPAQYAVTGKRVEPFWAGRPIKYSLRPPHNW